MRVDWRFRSPQFNETAYHPINQLALMKADSAIHFDPSTARVDAKRIKS